MLVQNVQTSSLFASGIFSVSGEKMTAKADKSSAFSSLFDGMTKMNVKDSGQIVNDTNTDPLQNGKAAPEAQTDGKANLKQAMKNVKGKENTEKPDGNVNAAENTGEIDEAEFEKVSSCLVSIVVTVVEFFNITPEELQGKLDSIGMNAIDLSDPDSLKQLFVSLDCGNDVSMLLTDQNLLNSFEDLMGKVNDLLEEFGASHEMISEVITECFGSENNFKIDLLGKDKADELKAEEENKVLTEVSEVAVGAPIDKNGEEKNFKLEFNKEDKGTENTSSDRKKNTATISENDQAEKFINNMIEKFRQNVSEVTGIDKAVSNLRSIADQILNQIKVNLTADVTSLEIRLTPEHLGKVSVQIQENDGVITAKFHTENQISKEAIESNLIQFKETLREQGIKVDSVEVSVSDFSFGKDKGSENNAADQNGEKNKRHFTIDEINARVDGTDLKEQSYIDDGISTVSYVA
jgi:flagellar hook-length control protein FliK